MTLSRIYALAPLGFPWVTAILVLGCCLTTLPMFFSSDYYLILGAGNEVADNPDIRWWHTIVTTFVHGGGFPGTTAHLLINSMFFLVLGVLIERTLGSGRFGALCTLCLFVGYVIKIGLSRYAHGISNVNWAFVPFAPIFIAHIWRLERVRALRDLVFVPLLVVFFLGIVGLINPWHGIATVVGFISMLAWRHALRRNLDRIDRGELPVVWNGRVRAAAIAVPAIAAAFSVGMMFAVVVCQFR